MTTDRDAAPGQAPPSRSPDDKLWVFAYGSLLWDPGFAPAEVAPARLEGFCRAFRMWSVRWRGTEAEPGLDRIHDRQPLVLDRDDWTAWLDPLVTDPAAVAELLGPRAPGRFTAYPVSRAVSSNRSNGPQLLEPEDPANLRGVVDPMTGEIVGPPA